MPLQVRVCKRESVVEGQLRAFHVTGVTWPVMVTSKDGELSAFPGVCPHEDVALEDYGVLEGNSVRCRVHGYTFDLATGECEHEPHLHLRRYKVTVRGDEVFVDLL